MTTTFVLKVEPSKSHPGGGPRGNYVEASHCWRPYFSHFRILNVFTSLGAALLSKWGNNSLLQPYTKHDLFIKTLSDFR